MFLCEDTSKFVEYRGIIYEFKKAYPYDQLWFIVKNRDKSQNIETVIAASQVWKSQKILGCVYESCIKEQLEVFDLKPQVSNCTLQCQKL
jgi:hypothetical protein